MTWRRASRYRPRSWNACERWAFERTADGEYLHAYSESFAGRFFFEVVQRVGDYDGYGAVNAPARLAAQVQHAASVVT